MSSDEVIRKAMNSWKGSHISKVESYWGYPTKTFKGTSGRTVYQWIDSKSATLPQNLSQNPRCNAYLARTTGCSPFSIGGGQTITRLCEKSFETDSNGIIITWKTNGNDCQDQFPSEWVPDKEEKPISSLVNQEDFQKTKDKQKEFFRSSFL